MRVVLLFIRLLVEKFNKHRHITLVFVHII